MRAALLPREVGEQAATRAKALADPTRLRVAMALAVGGELCVCDLAWVCGSAQNVVSHHLRILRSADLASSQRDGKLVMYRLNDEGRALLASVVDDTIEEVR